MGAMGSGRQRERGLRAKARRGAMLVGALLAVAAVAPRDASAQDRVVGREALDPADRENLGPAVDGRTDAPEDADPRALEEFREPLAPHGTWVDDGEYGTVWVPHAHEVGPDFYPYSSGGRWELTSEGDWLWVSDYSWGEIPFHYGRWVWISHRGWAWIPGRVWAPAWVTWRTGPYGYIGWAPCPPTWTWWGGSALWLYWPPPAAYVFVETRHVFHHHVHHHHVRDRARAQNAAAQTRPQRTPARPGSPSFDRSRPSSPDLASIRYDGPPPTKLPPRARPEIGYGKAGASTARQPGRRPSSGFSARDPDGRFARDPQAGRGADRWGPPPKTGRGAGSPSRPPEGRPSLPPEGPPPRGRGEAPSPRPDVDRGPSRTEDAPRPSRPRSESGGSDRSPRVDTPRPSSPGGAPPSWKPAARPTAAPAPPRPVPRPSGPARPRRSR